jgi:hypothetical protein
MGGGLKNPQLKGNEARGPPFAGFARPREKFLKQAKDQHMATRRRNTQTKRAGIDPMEVLAEIAADPNAPATARVAACKALLLASIETKSSRPDDIESALTRRALHLMNRGSSCK